MRFDRIRFFSVFGGESKCTFVCFRVPTYSESVLGGAAEALGQNSENRRKKQCFLTAQQIAGVKRTPPTGILWAVQTRGNIALLVYF